MADISAFSALSRTIVASFSNSSRSRRRMSWASVFHPKPRPTPPPSEQIRPTTKKAVPTPSWSPNASPMTDTAPSATTIEYRVSMNVRRVGSPNPSALIPFAARFIETISVMHSSDRRANSLPSPSERTGSTRSPALIRATRSPAH